MAAITYVILAEHIEEAHTKAGKVITFHRGFITTMSVPACPYSTPGFDFEFQVRYRSDEMGQSFRLDIALTREDDAVFSLPLGENDEITAPHVPYARPGKPLYASGGGRTGPFTIPEPGYYAITFSLDAVECSWAPLHVRLAE